MPQTTTTHNPCPECRPVFEGQRSHYCREFLRYQRENFAQRTEINALEVQLKHALEKLLKAERELIQAWKTSQPVAWGMLQKDGLILDVISPEEHENCEGEYTIPLVILQKAEPAAIIEVFDKDWRLEYLSLPVGKHKLYTQQYTYTTPPAHTTKETPKCSQA